MQIKIYAFEVSKGDGISFSEYLDFLESESAVQVGGDYFLPVTSAGALKVGLLLRPKNAGSFCKFKLTGNDFEVTTEELEKGTNIADFNFFLFNPDTGRGLYQHYHRSTSLTEFFMIFRERWRTLREAKIDEALKSESVEGDSVTKKVKLKFKALPKLNVIYRGDSFEKKVDQLKSITNFSFSIGTTVPKRGQRIGNAFVPASSEVKAIAATLRFHQNANIAQVKKLVKSVASTTGVESGHVYGEDIDGTELDYKLFNDADIFEVLPYESVASSLKINSKNLAATVKNADLANALVKLSQRADIKAILSAIP